MYCAFLSGNFIFLIVILILIQMRGGIRKWALAGVLAFAAGALCQAGDRGLPPAHGITNFGRVNDRLYRGSQPDAAGLAGLRALGVKTIICLRLANDQWGPEKEQAASNGMTFINIPLKGLGRPNGEDVTRALAVIEKSPGPVFVHCEHGCDRTGTIIACYRIRHDHWQAAAAQKEADRFGMSSLERGMRSYITEFGGALSKPPRGTPRQRGAGQNSSMVGASRCDARTAQRAVPTSEMKNFVLHPPAVREILARPGPPIC